MPIKVIVMSIAYRQRETSHKFNRFARLVSGRGKIGLAFSTGQQALKVLGSKRPERLARL